MNKSTHNISTYYSARLKKKFYSRRARNELALVQDLRNISQISTLVSAKWSKQVRSVDEPTFS